MKKTLTLAAIFIAMASYGSGVFLAHAQSLTPAQVAADQQQLDVLKAQLIYLQTQEGMVPAGDSGSPTATVPPTATITPAQTSMTLSASDVAAINTALTSLTGALVTLQTDIRNNPQILTTNGQGVANVLQGINTTLASIGTEMQNGSVAMAQPSQNSGGQAAAMGGSTGTGIAQSNPSVVATTPATSPTAVATTPATTPAAITPSANTAPQTAQAASSFSASKLNWPLIIVIILIVAAIAIWLWWDDGDDKKAKPVVKNISSAPQKSAPVVQITNNAPAATPSAQQPTPMSNVVSASSQQQIRKPA